MKDMMWRAGWGAIAAIAITLSGERAQAQQKSEIALSRQAGIVYMPSHIMEKQKLIEEHAAALGVRGVSTKWNARHEVCNYFSLPTLPPSSPAC